MENSDKIEQQRERERERERKRERERERINEMYKKSENKEGKEIKETICKSSKREREREREKERERSLKCVSNKTKINREKYKEPLL